MYFNDEKKEKALVQAKLLADDFNADEASEFANKHTNASWYEDFIMLYNMITDKKFSISKAAYIIIAGALAYVVLPVDVIPDFIPGIGFIDDVFVVGMVIKSVSGEINRYKEFQEL